MRRELPARRAGHEPAPLACRLDGVAAAHAVRPLIGRVERIGHASGGADPWAAGAPGGWLPARRCGFERRWRRDGLRLRERRLPDRHHVRDRLSGGRRAMPCCRGRQGRGPSGVAIIPRLGADPEVSPARPNSAWGGSRPRQAHHFDDPASRRATSTRDTPALSPLGLSGLAAAQSGEDTADVGHGSPGVRQLRPWPPAEAWGRRESWKEELVQRSEG
jgi:hypothetical protein